MRKQSSRYIDIAVDIATMIINGELDEGERISGRSTLAGKYNVSPETIRRAVTLLKDFGVVDSAPKSGIKVLSSRKAIAFIGQYQNKTSLLVLKNDMLSIIQQKNALEKELLEKVHQMIDQLAMQKDIGIIYPQEVDIPETSILIGRSIEELDFWQNTKATVVSVRRDGNTYLSPGPLWVVQAMDTLVFVGKKNSYSRVVDFVKQTL